MATPAAIAIRRSEAITRIAAATNQIASELGVEALSLPLTSRYPLLLHADQLVAIAEYLESIQVAITPEKKEVTDGKPDSQNKRPAVKAARR